MCLLDCNGDEECRSVLVLVVRVNVPEETEESGVL